MQWVKIEQKIVASDRLITANISGLDNRTFRHTAEKRNGRFGNITESQ